MTQGLGKVATKRLVRRAEAALEADVAAVESTVNAITLIPVFAYAVGASTLHVRFGSELDYDPVTLDTSAWDVTVAANGGSAGALTTTGSVSGASGLVVLSFSGTPFKLPAEEEQAIVLTYTPSGTNNLVDAAGRTVAGFTYSSILPRISDWRKAAYMLMAEQGSAPSTPASGYGLIYVGTDQDLHFLDDAGTDTSILGSITGFYTLLSGLFTDLTTGVSPFDPGVLFTEQGADPATPATGTWLVYAKAGGIYVIDDAGAVTGPFGVAGAGDGLGPDGDKGDVTVGGTGTTLTIDNNAVTYGKMQDMTTDRLLGRDTAGSGDPEELTVGGGIEFTGTGIQRSALTGAITASAGSGATSQVFSKGGTMVNSSGLSALTAIAWRAPFACTVTNVRGYRVGGSAATINARRNGTDNHLASDLSLGSADTWADGGAVQNTAYAAGDKLEIMLVSVTGATQVAIQVDFTRP